MPPNTNFWLHPWDRVGRDGGEKKIGICLVSGIGSVSSCGWANMVAVSGHIFSIISDKNDKTESGEDEHKALIKKVCAVRYQHDDEQSHVTVGSVY